MKYSSKIFTNKIWLLFFLLLFSYSTNTLQASNLNWKEVKKKASGKTVYFYAWGGQENINNYINWVGKQVKQKYNIKLKHIKTTDTALTVKQILTEKKSGTTKSSVDLVWINGENFKTLKDAKLLLKNLSSIPNTKNINYEDNPSASIDFSEPVDGQGVPWGTARLTFIYDSLFTKKPPGSYLDLLSFLKKNKYKFTYPAPPEFHGTTFLKQLLVETINPKYLDQLAKPINPNNRKEFLKLTQPLWKYLNQLHPLLWRKGGNFPTSLGNMNQLFNDKEIFLSLTFNPNFVANQIYNEEFPKTTKSYSHKKGSIGNTHFLAIPNKSSVKEAAMVVINYFISPEAQARKANIIYWGDPTVLAVKKLSKKEQHYFTQIPGGIKAVKELQVAPTILEPHSSWTGMLESEWLRRYGK